MTWQEQLKTATEHHLAGRFEEAQFLYRQVLAAEPNHADALRLAGVASFQLGHTLAAVELLERAIACDPEGAEAHCDLGLVLFNLERVAEAISCYNKAIALRPEFPEAHFNLGFAYYSCGKLNDAVAEYCAALESRPDDPETLVNLGNALHARGEYEAAVRAYQRALEVRPGLTEAYNNLGNSLQVLGLLDRAQGAYLDALDLSAENFQSQINLGLVLKSMGNVRAALVSLDQAIELRPDVAAIQSVRIDALHSIEEDPAAILSECVMWDRRHGVDLKSQWKGHENDGSPGRKLRIGYISADFRDYGIGRNLLPLWREHDRELFDPYFYSDLLRPDWMTERISGLSDHWTNIVGQSDELVAEKIRGDKIDILVDLSMHGPRNRLLVFARRPAPVQIVFGAYPGGTGLRAMQYRLTDPFLDPAGETDHYYSENSIRLPESYFCYDSEAMDLASAPDVSPLAAAKNKYVTFGCLNQFHKVSDAALRLWAEALNGAPGSRLLLLSPEGSARDRVREFVGDRVEFVARCARAEFLQLFGRIDICLDTYPFNGQRTTFDSLWMGAPVVTRAGIAPVGRMGFSILSNLGLGELAARDDGQFVKIASALAKDLPRLRRLRWTLRQKMVGSAVMDAKRFALSVESAYRTCWKAWCGSSGGDSN